LYINGIFLIVLGMEKEKNSLISCLAALIIFIIISPLSYAESFGNKQVDDLYSKVLDATFPGEKEVFVRKLGKLGNEAAKKALLSLFDDSDSWNQEAAITGLLLLDMPEIDRLLVERLLADFMLEEDIAEGIARYGDRFIRLLITRYEGAESEEHRETLLETIALLKNSKAREFLKSLAQDKNAQDRLLSFQFLIEHFSLDKEYITQFFDDPELKEYAFSWLVDHGTEEDLGFFLKIIDDKKEADVYVIIAYEAVDKWGKYIIKQKVYLLALQSDNEVLIQGAMYIFNTVRSKPIMSALCRLIKKGEYQDTRIIAASALSGYDDKEAVPYLISALKEVYYEEREPLGIKLLSTIFTFGISSILDSISSSMSEKDFDSRMRNIASGLSRITNADNGISYEEWLDWGVYHGYSVDGMNIIQYLFHGNALKRKKALTAAYVLLGFKTNKEFIIKHPEYKNKTDEELALILAAMLIEKGYLVDEEY